MRNNRKQSSPDINPLRRPRKKTTNEPQSSQENGLTVVGIGASAGGLKALQTFFEVLPNDTGLAFVVVTHLHPEHESHLAEILQNNTKMRVRQVTGEVSVQSNHLCVTPPRRSILMTDSTVDIEEFRESGGRRSSVDDRTDDVAISFVDINEVKKAQRARRDYQSFYTLFHANPIPTLLIRLEDNVVMNANQALLDYLNLSREEVLNHTAQEFNLGLNLHSKERSALTSQLLKDGAIRNFEEEIELPSGETASVLTSIQYIYIEEKDAIISCFIDITERVQAERQIRQLTIDLTTAEQEERYRIAQMLHDDLQQRIFAVKMQLENTGEAIEKGELQSVSLDFAKLEEWLTEAISITRQLSTDLSPLSLKGEELTEVILWLSSQMKGQYGLEVELDTDGVQASFENNVQLILFHAIRELLFNVVKHAGVLKAKITLRLVSRDWVRIIVSDKGIGFEPETVMANDDMVGYGLVSMKRRLELFGCRLDVDSAVDRGARVTIDCPLGTSGSRL